jgi:very-short-patch-repair endonuclease
MPRQPVATPLRGHAKAMRRAPTDAEKALWRILRDRRLSMLKFRRQVPIEPYIVDFVCFERRLIVEADGSQHAENPRDEMRDAFLGQQGFQVLRFWNHEILTNPRMVEATILARCGLPW